MNANEQRIAIAEFCGWKWYRIPHSETWNPGPMRALFHPAVHEIDQDSIWLQPGQPTDRIASMEYMGRDGMVPDYLKDLNAMHAVLQDKIVGNEELEKRFIKELNAIIDRRADDDTLCIFEYETAQINATAEQRAEALLRTIDKWKE